MRNSPNLTPLLLAAALVAPASATVIATEYFNGYGTSEVTDDTALNGGTGWDGAWTASDQKYVPGSSLNDAATGYDNSANLGGAGDGAFAYQGNGPDSSVAVRSFTTSATTLWFSAQISIDETWDRALLWLDLGGAFGSGDNDFVGVLDGNVQMRYDGTNYNSTAVSATGTYLLLAKAELNVSGNNDRLSFWFNPDLSSGEGGLGSALYTDDTADTFGNAIDGIGVMLVDRDFDGSSYSTDADTALENGELMDAIRVGTAFADVTAIPEPSTSGLLGGLVLLALLRRRREV